MNNNKLIEELDGIAREIAEIESELLVMERCMSDGLNYDDHSEYSRAVMAVHRRDASKSSPGSNSGSPELLQSNSLACGGESCYNQDIREYFNTCRERLDSISCYGFKDLWKKIGREAMKLLDVNTEVRRVNDETRR